jgi:hypothetical protein
MWKIASDAHPKTLGWMGVRIIPFSDVQIMVGLKAGLWRLNSTPVLILHSREHIITISRNIGNSFHKPCRTAIFSHPVERFPQYFFPQKLETGETIGTVNKFPREYQFDSPLEGGGCGSVNTKSDIFLQFLPPLLQFLWSFQGPVTDQSRPSSGMWMCYFDQGHVLFLVLNKHWLRWLRRPIHFHFPQVQCQAANTAASANVYFCLIFFFLLNGLKLSSPVFL